MGRRPLLSILRFWFWTEALRIFAIHEYIVVLIKFEYFTGTTGVLSNFFKHEMSKK